MEYSILGYLTLGYGIFHGPLRRHLVPACLIRVRVLEDCDWRFLSLPPWASWFSSFCLFPSGVLPGALLLPPCLCLRASPSSCFWGHFLSDRRRRNENHKRKTEAIFFGFSVLLESMAATSLALHKVSCFSGEHVEVGTAHVRSSRSVSSRFSLCLLLLQIPLLCGYLSLSLSLSLCCLARWRPEGFGRREVVMSS